MSHERFPHADHSADAIRVHVHSTGAMGLFTNAFLVETARSVVAIDSMMTISDARGLRARVEQIGKPLVAVIITHGHPDHYNGVTELIGGGHVPVIATAGVDAHIRRIDDAKEIQWKPVFGADWPAVRTFPNQFVRDGETLTFDDVPFTVRELGEGESHCDTYWQVGRSSSAVFAGDIVFNTMHSYTSDGHTAAWLASLDVVSRELRGGPTVYIGHGAGGTLGDMLAAQRRYLTAYRSEVQQLARGASSLDDGGKAALTRAMKSILPTDDLADFIAAGANPVAAELAREAT